MPDMKYGVSYEAPTYFTGKNTLICKDSYNNPYINYNKDSLNKN